MKTLANLYLTKFRSLIPGSILLLFTWMMWPVLQKLTWNLEGTSGFIDPAIWILIALSFGCFLFLLALSAWLLRTLWKAFNLPSPALIISQFNSLASCQKLQFLFAAYALLLFAGVGCLAAIC